MGKKSCVWGDKGRNQIYPSNRRLVCKSSLAQRAATQLDRTLLIFFLSMRADRLQAWQGMCDCLLRASQNESGAYKCAASSNASWLRSNLRASVTRCKLSSGLNHYPANYILFKNRSKILRNSRNARRSPAMTVSSHDSISITSTN